MVTVPAVRRLAALAAALLLCGCEAVAQGLSESTGVSQYFANCARCHESAEAPQAPRTAVLKQMPPERIYESLTTGTMRTQAAHLTDQERRLIAEWVGGRKIDHDLAGAADTMTNQCASHTPVRRLTAPGWNGWGVDHRNSRSQPAAAAGLSPGQVSRLTLKWAFGFPGATALYSQTLVDGRLYVSSNAGYVYSLDADTGCVHWAFRSQSVVRSGFTVGRMSRTSDRLTHVLKNTGAAPIRTNVYNHNFMTIDKQPPGPDYEIAFPFEVQRAQRGAQGGAAGALPREAPHQAGRAARRGLVPPAVRAGRARAAV